MRPALRAALVAIPVYVAACAVPDGGLFRAARFRDVHVYQGYAEKLLHGALPYRDVFVEYPPGAFAVFMPPTAFGAAHYNAAFKSLMAICGVATLVLLALVLTELRASTTRTRIAVALFALSPIALGPISLNTYDAWPALLTMLALWLFLRRTYLGTAIRAISQDRAIMPLMGVDPARIFALTSALGGALAGLAACLLVLQYDVHPAIGLSFGPITFLICVLGGLGNLVGGFIAAFIFAQFISVGGFFLHIEWGYVLAFAFFIVMMFIRPAGLLARRR